MSKTYDLSKQKCNVSLLLYFQMIPGSINRNLVTKITMNSFNGFYVAIKKKKALKSSLSVEKEQLTKYSKRKGKVLNGLYSTLQFV